MCGVPKGAYDAHCNGPKSAGRSPVGGVDTLPSNAAPRSYASPDQEPKDTFVGRTARKAQPRATKPSLVDQGIAAAQRLGRLIQDKIGRDQPAPEVSPTPR